MLTYKCDEIAAMFTLTFSKYPSNPRYDYVNKTKPHVHGVCYMFITSAFLMTVEVWPKYARVCRLLICSSKSFTDFSCDVRSAIPWIRTYKNNPFNTLRPRQDGRHLADDIFKYIFLSEIVWFSIKNSLKFVPKGPIDNITALIQIMAWRRPGDKPLSELMMVSLLTHICVTRPQWVNS